MISYEMMLSGAVLNILNLKALRSDVSILKTAGNRELFTSS